MRPTVLIVDDSLTVRMDLDEAFAGGDFDRVQCADLASARRALAERTFDAVVLDLLLPDGDGLDLLREVRGSARHRSTPVLLLSSETDVHDRIHGLETGADEYVGKPYDAALVVARARELVRRAHPPGSRDAERLVLVIDDSATSREGLRSALEQAGHAVVSASSGEEGLRVAADRRPDAIIVDGVLPGIDGATVVRRIRDDAALRRTPTLLVTGTEDVGGELRAFEAGADAFVRKDEGDAVVMARLEAVLRGTAAAAAPLAASLLGPKRILAVDDSATYLEELAEQLRTAEYEVVLARSGEEALALLQVDRVDCILLDVMMPGLSGYETCRRIRANAALRNVPLVMLTSIEDQAALIEGINAGADDWVPKSSDMSVVLARVRAQLRRKQFEDENEAIREELLRKEVEAAEARAAREAHAENAAILQEADRRKNEFLGVLSHELRNPLAPIRNALFILRRAQPGGEQANRAQAVIERQVGHLTRLVDDLLDVTRISRGKIQLVRVRTDLAEVVRRTAEDHKGLFAGGQLALEVSCPQPLWVEGDVTRLAQIVGNLLANAAKFTDPGGHVRVSAAREGAFAVVRVRDSGIGIAAEVLPRVFDAFVQEEATLHRSRGGLGLGLSLVRGLVEMHGGRVTAHSDGLDQGSEFTISLPTASGAPGPSPRTEGRAAPPRRRVVLVEDNQDAAETLREVLELGGHDVVAVAHDGNTGIERVRALQPDVVLCDVGLPGKDGYEVARAIRSDPALAATRLVALTGYATPEDQRRAAEAGFDHHLSKPANLKQLEDIFSLG
jgi:DNA-binding response OmpR family regulator